MCFYKKIKNVLILLLSIGSNDFLNQFVNFLLDKFDSLRYMSVVYKADTLTGQSEQKHFTHALEQELFSSNLKFSCRVVIQFAMLHLYKYTKKCSKKKSIANTKIGVWINHLFFKSAINYSVINTTLTYIVLQINYSATNYSVTNTTKNICYSYGATQDLGKMGLRCRC